MPLSLKQKQEAVCELYGSPFSLPGASTKVGIAENIREHIFPLNGLRHLPEGDTCGWYFWAGKNFPQESDFFKSLHTSHLIEWNADLLPYLGLAPGWRFLIAPDYEDVWFDPALMEN